TPLPSSPLSVITIFVAGVLNPAFHPIPSHPIPFDAIPHASIHSCVCRSQNRSFACIVLHGFAFFHPPLCPSLSLPSPPPPLLCPGPIRWFVALQQTVPRVLHRRVCPFVHSFLRLTDFD